MGGEKLHFCRRLLSGLGSPPRGRGKVQQRRSTGKQTGITPAWAGKSGSFVLTAGRSWDHPRVGGEKRKVRVSDYAALGSPPRGRGKEHKAEIWRQGYRITPAWAGKSLMKNFCRRLDKDHPRVGGEKWKQKTHKDCGEGSPPRGRGKGSREVAKYASSRITPAWAGKSSHETLEVVPQKDHPRVGGEKTKKIP